MAGATLMVVFTRVGLRGRRRGATHGAIASAQSATTWGSEQTFWNLAGIGGHGPTDMVRFFQGRRAVGVDDATFPI